LRVSDRVVELIKKGLELAGNSEQARLPEEAQRRKLLEHSLELSVTAFNLEISNSYRRGGVTLGLLDTDSS
jgi:hypothetical protein